MDGQMITAETAGNAYAHARQVAAQRESRRLDIGDVAIADRIAHLESMSMEMSTRLGQVTDQLRRSEERLVSLFRGAVPPTPATVGEEVSIAYGGRGGQRIEPDSAEPARRATAAAPMVDSLILDWLQCATALLDGNSQLRQLNRQAQQLLNRSDSLYVRANRLHCHDATQNARLAKLLSQAAAGNGGGLIIHAAGRPPIHVLAFPLRRVRSLMRESASLTPIAPESPLDGIDTGFAVVFGPRAGIAEGTLEILAVLYGLTPAERRVLRELAQERSPIQIAERTGVSIRTVRSQLSSIFSKTGARSQRDLLALAVGLPPFALA